MDFQRRHVIWGLEVPLSYLYYKNWIILQPTLRVYLCIYAHYTWSLAFSAASRSRNLLNVLAPYGQTKPFRRPVKIVSRSGEDYTFQTYVWA